MSEGKWRQRGRRLLGLLDAAQANYLWRPESTRGVVWQLERWAQEHPDDPYLSFEGQHWTIGAFYDEVQQHAAAYAARGIAGGDVVALMLSNRPAYLFHFYALLSRGAVAALINPALREHALTHALETCAARLLVCEPAGSEALAALPTLPRSLHGARSVYLDREAGDEIPCALEGARSWRETLDALAATPAPETVPRPLSSLAAYIYTSGTTGLPKAARVKHHRFYRAGRIFGDIVGAHAADALYLCLPLYHGNASMIGVPLTLVHRTRLILARRFSASRFFSDCAVEGATLAIYIGELCRFLLQSAEGPADRAHGVRRILGNGLDASLWQPFCDRFGIEQVAEFYAATEGNAETANLLGIPGSCGPLIPSKMALARYDVEAEALLRNRRGFCERAAAGEPGLLLGAISDKNAFDGYADAKSTQGKILRDVFRRGDAWFNTGDLLRRDHLRHLYFVDRLGDTFRWRGENVSTQEVAQALALHPRIDACVAYGVEVAGQEGRCGMAAFVIPQGKLSDLDLRQIYAHLEARLPGYAQPRFLRQVRELELTGTFKPRKQALQQAGFRPRGSKDPMWLRDPRQQTYVPLDAERYAAVQAGRWPL